MLWQEPAIVINQLVFPVGDERVVNGSDLHLSVVQIPSLGKGGYYNFRNTAGFYSLFKQVNKPNTSGQCMQLLKINRLYLYKFYNLCLNALFI